MAAVVKPLETVEEWLNDLSCQFQEEKLQEDEILKDQFRDLNVLEDNLQSHESLLKELSVGEVCHVSKGTVVCFVAKLSILVCTLMHFK